MAIARATISKPASILRTLFALTTVISRCESVNATAAGSFQSDEEVEPLLKTWAVFSSSPQVFRNLFKTLVGGLRSSNNYNSAKQSQRF
jgi:hypothetical protein